MTKTILTGLIAICLIAVPGPAQKAGEAQTALQTAIKKEIVDGDLNGAIKQYSAIATKYAKTARATAAMALFREAEAYQKLGDAQSKKIYEQVVKDFGDQKEAVTLAKARLGTADSASGRGEMTAVSVWHGPTGAGINIASDLPLITYRNNLTGDLMLRNVGTGENRNLTNVGPQEKGRLRNAAVISPDGKNVAYLWSTLIGPDGKTVAPSANREDRMEIRTIGSDGAGMRIHVTGKHASMPDLVAISPDNKALLVAPWVDKSGSSPAHPVLQRLSLTDDTLTPFAGGFWGDEASFSPDGKLVTLAGSVQTPDRGLYVANADGTDLRSLVAEPVFSSCWTPDGKWIVFGSERSGGKALWAVPAAGGEPRLVKQEADLNWLYGFTRDGSLFYGTGHSLTDIVIAKLDPVTHAVTGEPSQFIHASTGQNDGLRFSPDGKWIAWRSLRKEGYVLVVRATAGADERVVNKLAGIGTFGWFPDSSALLVRQFAGQPSVFDRIDIADGHVTELDWGTFPPGMPAIADGGRVLLWLRCESAGCALVRIDTQTKAETTEPLNEISNRGPNALSPDGKWLALVGRAPSGTAASLFVRPTAAGGKMVELVSGIVVTTGTPSFAFTPDSRQLIYQPAAQPNEFRIVPVEGGQSVSIPLKGEFPDFSPDGRLTYTRTTGSADVWMLRNLRFN